MSAANRNCPCFLLWVRSARHGITDCRASAHDADPLIEVAFIINSHTASHDTDFVAGKFIVRVTYQCSDTPTALILNSAEARI